MHHPHSMHVFVNQIEKDRRRASQLPNWQPANSRLEECKSRAELYDSILTGRLSQGVGGYPSSTLNSERETGTTSLSRQLADELNDLLPAGK